MKINRILIIIFLLLPLSCSVTFWNSYRYYNSVDDAVNAWADYKRLDMSDQNITELPSDMVRLKDKNFIILRANNNQISSLPDFICELPSLNVIMLNNNAFTDLPMLRCNNQKIDVQIFAELELSGNKIQSIPDDLSYLGVNWLDLSRNQITFVPENIKWSPLLSKIKLSQNSIKSLPKSFGKNHLYQMYFDHNQITELPDSLGVDTKELMPSGHYTYFRNEQDIVDFSYNKISNVSETFLQNNTKIKKLILTGNPLSDEEIEKVRKALPNTEVVF